MANIVVLGSGLVGNVIAQDLSEQHTVKVVDKYESALLKLSNKKTFTQLPQMLLIQTLYIPS